MINIKSIPLIASTFGFLALIPDAKNITKQKDFSDYSFHVTVLYLISVGLWLIYELYNKNWTSVIGLVVTFLINLRILCGIVATKGPVKPSTSRVMTADLFGYTFER